MSSTAQNDFNFPFQPYGIQEEFMRELYRVLAEEKIGIFESPTGETRLLPNKMKEILLK